LLTQGLLRDGAGNTPGMSTKRKVLRGSLLLLAGEATIYGCSFVRNMILARMLTKADFGIAATFSLIITLLEMSDKVGMARFVVRDKDGHAADFISAAHLVHFAVAVLGAVSIALCATPLSSLFGVPDQWAAFLVLSLIPLCRGLEHLDPRRFERDLKFVPSLLVEAIPQVALTLAAWPITAWFGDYRAVLALLLTKGLVSCVASHLVAENRYRWRVHRQYLMRMVRFGWPLLFNGFLMFGVLQGDQFLIAARYSVIDLAPYAAAAGLTMAPTFFFARVFNSVMLPILAAVQDDPSAFRGRYEKVLAAVTVFAVASGFGMILAAEALMRLTYGEQYAGSGVLLGWLVAANTLRTVRIAPALAAIAKGDSKNQMLSNLWRIIALAPAAAIAYAQGPLWSIAAAGLIGEGFACWSSCARLQRRDGVPLFTSLLPTGWALTSVAIAGLLVFSGFYELPMSLGLTLAALGACAATIGVVTALREPRRAAASLYSLWRESGFRGCISVLTGGESRTGLAAS
jgi:O-antigen/teichoic acid export membrane protein